MKYPPSNRQIYSHAIFFTFGIILIVGGIIIFSVPIFPVSNMTTKLTNESDIYSRYKDGGNGSYAYSTVSSDTVDKVS